MVTIWIWALWPHRPWIFKMWQFFSSQKKAVSGIFRDSRNYDSIALSHCLLQAWAAGLVPKDPEYTDKRYRGKKTHQNPSKCFELEIFCNTHTMLRMHGGVLSYKYVIGKDQVHSKMMPLKKKKVPYHLLLSPSPDVEITMSSVSLTDFLRM